MSETKKNRHYSKFIPTLSINHSMKSPLKPKRQRIFSITKAHLLQSHLLFLYSPLAISSLTPTANSPPYSHPILLTSRFENHRPRFVWFELFLGINVFFIFEFDGFGTWSRDFCCCFCVIFVRIHLNMYSRVCTLPKGAEAEEGHEVSGSVGSEYSSPKKNKQDGFLLS